MKATLESHSGSPDSIKLSFREDSVIPDGYFANVFIFFILLIGIGTVVAKLLKGRIPGMQHTMLGLRNQQSMIKHTERLPSGARLHFIEYQGTSLVVMESRTGVGIQVLQHSHSTMGPKCQDTKRSYQ